MASAHKVLLAVQDEVALGEALRADLFEALVAQATLVREPPKQTADFDRYVTAAADAHAACIRILRNNPSLERAEQDLLLEQLDSYGHTLAQLNRLIQTVHALA